MAKEREEEVRVEHADFSHTPEAACPICDARAMLEGEDATRDGEDS